MISSENGLLLATVLLNVQGRDVGGFVDEARAARRARRVAAGRLLHRLERPLGEPGARARSGCRSCCRSCSSSSSCCSTSPTTRALEAAHVLLAVPFALTGGVYLLWLLGYNFSVAVWVGFIALFGTAVQTGVVMVIYLEEAVARKRRETGRRADARGAARRGHRRRAAAAAAEGDDGLTVVAGLLPIMWSTRVGAEVMKPLATPVLGGMVSSLLHVLIVTPVIFFWLHERRLGLQHEPLPDADTEPALGRRRDRRGRRRAAARGGFAWSCGGRRDGSMPPPTISSGPGRANGPQRRSADRDVCRRPARCTRAATRSRSSSVPPTVSCVDVGAVRASANMTMPGMVMSGGLEVHRTIAPAATRRPPSSAWPAPGTWRSNGTVRRDTGRSISKGQCNEEARVASSQSVSSWSAWPGARRNRRRDNRQPPHPISTRRVD